MADPKWKGGKGKGGKKAQQAAASAEATAEEPKAAPKAEPKKETKAAPKDKDASKEAPKFVNTTPKGQMKDMTTAMAENYQPGAVESSWNDYWEGQGLFKPINETKATPADNFVMVIPPPNVTGTLHIGHALTCSIEDAITRWNRMSGKNTLWVPGTDHAGIATQVVVEKKIMRENKQTRHDLGREKFVEQVWKWKEQSGNKICGQLRRLGASVDWSRERFTMDDMSNKAVTEAFVRMHQDGLIYRSNRLVNWSCALRTAISSIEVDTKELSGPTMLKVPGYADPVEFGVLHSFEYKFADGSGGVVVATTRIETMLGDVAVAVHSSDARYKEHVGKKLIHPFIKGREMVLITDDVLVDPKFGTGAVKITPAHDPNDFQCGERNKLPSINIFDDAGFINENGGDFKGQPRFVARVNVLSELKKIGAYKTKTSNPMNLAFCQRSSDVVEPVLRPQWWVSCGGMAAQAVREVREGRLQIVPEEHTRTWYQWLENVQDWCISRQLWWGHRIPAYFVSFAGEQKGAKQDIGENWVVARTLEEAKKIAYAKFSKVPKEKIILTQDEDVLDTWFSSGLFPFSTLGWPDESSDMKNFYPGTLLETGSDILFFWVARMVMMGLQLTKKLPFTKVYLHSMVRDKLGRKMSKSKGNVVDPLDVIDGISLENLLKQLTSGNLDPTELKIASDGHRQDFPQGIVECGADALRMGLLAYTSQGQAINLDIKRIVAYRQFCNKLWHATRFAMLNLPADYKPPASLADVTAMVAKTNRFADRWILSRLAFAVQRLDKGFTNYEFAEATTAIHNFWYDDFCIVYLEAIKRVLYFDKVHEEKSEEPPAESKGDEKRGGKPEKKAKEKKPAKQLSAEEIKTLTAERECAWATLYTCLDIGFKLTHPIMPFVSEELYQRLPGKAAERKAWKGERKSHFSLMMQAMPKPAATQAWLDSKVEGQMEVIKQIAEASRSTRSALGLTTTRLPLFVDCATTDLFTIVKNNLPEITTLSFAESITPLDRTKTKAPEGCMSTVVNQSLSLHVPLSGVLDLSKEVIKMEKSQRELEASTQNLKASISSPAYAERTKPEIQAQHKAKLAENTASLEQIAHSIAKYMAAMTPEQKGQYKKNKVADLQAQAAKSFKNAEKSAPSKGKPWTRKSADTVNACRGEIVALEAEIAAMCKEAGFPVPKSILDEKFPVPQLAEDGAAGSAGAAGAGAAGAGAGAGRAAAGLHLAYFCPSY